MSVCLGCYDKIPQMRYHINNRNLFLRVLEASRFQKQGSSTVVFWWEPSSLFIASTFWLCPHMMRGTGEFFGVFFIKGTNPIYENPLSWPKHLPTAPLSNTTTLGIRIPTCELGRGVRTHLDYSRSCTAPTVPCTVHALGQRNVSLVFKMNILES